MKKEFVWPKMEVTLINNMFLTGNGSKCGDATASVDPMSCGDYNPDCDCDCNSVGNWDFDEMDF